ncbi:hypothetical protein [Muricoccus radiodurans]|uniref:hypothetical protein n=1 Tax=Muricoccus radiodurans TaxID=2231721 RepID=UPI003CF7BBC5
MIPVKRGMVAIWSDVEAAARTDYLHWLTREHAAERVGTEGFEGVRVHRADRDDVNRYLIVYDLSRAAVLDSPAYLARLNDPTPWSRRIMPGLRNFARGGGDVVAEAGRGQGAHVAAFRLGGRPKADPALLEAIVAEDGICAARLLDVDAAATGVPTQERGLRQGDRSFPGLLLVEALDAAALRAALDRHGAAVRALAGGVEEASTYTLFFALQRTELGRAAGGA